MGGILNTMQTCEEISRSIASDELSDANWRQRMAVKLHLLLCRHCRRYASQIDQIGEAAKEVFSDQPAERESRDRLRSAILESLPTSDQSDPDPRV